MLLPTANRRYPRSGLRITPEADPKALADGRIDPFPRIVDPPGPEVVVNGLPGRQVVGQQAPSTSATQHVEEDGIEDLAQEMDSRAPGTFGGQAGGTRCRSTHRRRGLFGMLFSAR